MISLKGPLKIHRIEAAAYNYFTKWYNPAIREILLFGERKLPLSSWQIPAPDAAGDELLSDRVGQLGPDSGSDRESMVKPHGLNYDFGKRTMPFVADNHALIVANPANSGVNSTEPS